MLSGRRWWTVLLLAVAVLLHLPAHLGVQSERSPYRDTLILDGPVVATNRAFEARGVESTADLALRALRDPTASFDDTTGVVGRARWRPVSTLSFLLERRLFGDGVTSGVDAANLGASAVRGVAVVSLLLHLLSVLGTLSLARRLGLADGPAYLAAAVVATAPAALVAAAWPAQQAAVLASVLGVFGLSFTLRDSLRARLLGGLLIALAALSHGAAFALVPAAVLLPLARGVRLRAGAVAAAAFPGVAALVGTWWVLSAAARPLPEGADLAARAPGVLDGAVGALAGAVAVLVPGPLHFADGPWTSGVLGHGVALVVLVSGAALLWKAWTPGRPGLAPVVAAAGVAVVAASVPSALMGGAPYHEIILAVVLPLIACAVASIVASGLLSAKSRKVAAVAGALLVAAATAATATRAHQFRTRAGFVRMASREMPGSVVAAAWAFDETVSRAPEIRALAASADRLADLASAPGAPSLRNDPVAAWAVSSALLRFAARTTETLRNGRAAVAPGDDVCDTAEHAARVATDLVPYAPRAWIVLATARGRQGALRGGFEACRAALALAPLDVDVLETSTRLSLQIGLGRMAADMSETLLDAEFTAARDEGRPVRERLELLRAEAITADGATRVSDGLVNSPVRPRFEVAVGVLTQLLQQLKDQPDQAALTQDVRNALYRTYLLYGDYLASTDQTALAIYSYVAAVDLKVDDDEAREHGMWLTDRLKQEEAAALASVKLAAEGQGNQADALVALAIAFSRQAKWKEAGEVFDRLEEATQPTPALRFLRALHLDRTREPLKARTELEAVVREDPSFGRAWYELGRLREEFGDLDGALKAHDRAVQTQEQSSSPTSEDWWLDARARREAVNEMKLLEQTTR